MLVSAAAAIAVSVSVFELPVIRDVMSGADPASTIEQRLADDDGFGRKLGIAVGAVIFVLFV